MNANKLTVTVALFFFFSFQKSSFSGRVRRFPYALMFNLKKKDLKFSMIMSQMTLAKMVG